MPCSAEGWGRLPADIDIDTVLKSASYLRDPTRLLMPAVLAPDRVWAVSASSRDMASEGTKGASEGPGAARLMATYAARSGSTGTTGQSDPNAMCTPACRTHINLGFLADTELDLPCSGLSCLPDRSRDRLLSPTHVHTLRFCST